MKISCNVHSDINVLRLLLKITHEGCFIEDANTPVVDVCLLILLLLLALTTLGKMHFTENMVTEDGQDFNMHFFCNLVDIHRFDIIMLSRPVSVMFIEHHCSAHGPNLLNQVSGVALRSTGVSPRSRYMDRLFLVIQVDGVDFLVRISFRGQKRTHILRSLLVDTIIHIPCNSDIISKSIHRSCKRHCNP